MIRALEALRGDSPRIVQIRTQVEHLLARQASARRVPPILILGETGTGKGLLAQAIHRAGPRRDGPFVAINCAAIPETLLEAELFGHERGAFTDARRARPGLVQAAHAGTLFLDEIGLLPVVLQGKLLTVLEDRAVRRLGSTRAEPIDVALVAATSVDLPRAIGEGRFRADLYHRIAVIGLELPPLRARGRDVLQLAEHFLARACADYGLAGRVLTPGARDRIAAYPWPGNVRELANALERVVLLSTGDEITAAMLDFLAAPPAATPAPADAGAPAAHGSLDDALRARVEAALGATGGNIRRSAVALGISRNTLRARMDKYGLRHREPAAAPPTPSPRPGPAEWERRHLTFLRARLLPASSLDAPAALETIAAKVESFGGRVEESRADGLVAVFGVEPVDNAPSHAALAALAVHNAAARARRADVVIGIHGDHHVVRRQGDAVDVAAGDRAATWPILEALVAADRPGATLVTDEIVPFLTRRFALERLPDAARAAWSVLRREEAVPSAWTRFVGRASELSMLRRASADVEQGHGQVVGIVGEAGVGKSRLLHEAVRLLHGWRVLCAGGAPYAAHTSYFPLVELLKSLCRVQDTDTAAEVRERLARALPAGAGDPHVLIPALLDVLGVSPPGDAFRDLDPARRRERTHEALRQVLVAAGAAQPLCLVVEDLHWIDAETQEVLDRLVTGLPSARVLLLVNYRPDYRHPWGTRTYYAQLRLDALPAESAGELLDALLGEDAGLAPLKARLIRRGNPFFLEETVRTLVETGALEGGRGAYRMTRPQQALLVPPTVQAILAARIDRLPAEDRQLLQAASAIGVDVPRALLAAIAERPEEDLARGLGRLQDAELLYETRLYPDPEYTFRHALTHEVTYGGLLPDRRRALHARVVRAIEALHRDRLGEQIERLAHHAVQGELGEEAAHYLDLAGRRAAARATPAEARAWFDRALSALAALPPTPATRERGCDVRLELSLVLGQLGEARQALDHLREAEPLADRLDDDRRRGRVHALMTNVYSALGELDQALASGTRALRIAERVGDPGLRIPATTYLAQVHYFRGEYGRVVALTTANLAALPAEGAASDFGLSTPPAIFDRCYLIVSLAQLGRFAEAAEPEAEVLRLAAPMSQAFTVGWAHFAAGSVRLLRGEWAEARPRLERATAVLGAGNVAALLSESVSSLALVLAQLGEADEALRRLREGERTVEVQAAGGHVGSLAPLYRRLSRAALALDRLDDARRLCDLAIGSSATRPGAQALHLLGDLASALGGSAAASGFAHYREALALAEPRGMRPLAAHCHLGLGALAMRTGARDEGRADLAIASAMYREMGMAHWLERAEAAAIGRG